MRPVVTIIFVFAALSVSAQTVISGKVVDESGAGLPLANILIEDSYDGTTSDPEGKFSFITTEHGKKTLIIRFIGFKEHRHDVQLNNSPIEIIVTMYEAISELNAVTITAGSFTASDDSRRTVFRAVDIATTAGATADIAGALNTLPGTQKVGESGRLFVRGGDGHEARTFIDGLVVLDAYSPSGPNTPSRGRFLPFMFKGTSFSTGGYSSEYGQALSSALVLDSKDNIETDRTDIGILSVGGDVAHTQAWDGGSATAKVQYTNIRPYYGLISQEIDWKNAPVSYEGISAFRQKVGDGMLKVFGNFNHTNFSLYQHDIDDQSRKQLYDLTNRFTYLNGSYRNVLNEKWIVRGGLSYTVNGNDTRIEANSIVEEERGVHGKVVFEGSLHEQVELKTGTEIISRDYSYVGASDLNFKEYLSAAFAELDLYASNNFVTRAGARVEHNGLQQIVSIDPRFSIAYRTGVDGQVSVAYGIFRQSPKNEFLRVVRDLTSEKAAHFILNYQRISDDRTLRIETYVKKYDDLIRYSTQSRGDLNNTGDGYAKGLEFFWRDKRSVSKLDYWLSYSFLDTKRLYLDFPVRAVPSFASKHNFSAVTKYFIQEMKSQLGVTYSFASGRTFANPNQQAFHSQLTPNYHDLSFNWSYLPKPHMIMYFSCTNLTGRDNIFGYKFSNNLNEHGFYNSQPVRLPAKRFLFIGIFITLSKEKSVNQLPVL